MALSWKFVLCAALLVAVATAQSTETASPVTSTAPSTSPSPSPPSSPSTEYEDGGENEGLPTDYDDEMEPGVNGAGGFKASAAVAAVVGAAVLIA